MISIKAIWFKAKKYGWGWHPIKWQGWVILFVWMILFLFALNDLDRNLLEGFLEVFILIALLILICYKKGEKPAWHWGNK
jgi:hypothetical protein